MQEMIKIHSFFNSCASALSQRAGLAALARTEESLAMTAEYRQRRDWLVDALNRLPGVHCPKPSGAFYVFPNISAYGLAAEEFSMRLLNTAHVTSVAGTAFGPTGEGHIRLSYAASLRVLQTGVERIAAALPAMRG
jgi:aspartate/methionine/tyrosine aminotransferase